MESLDGDRIDRLIASPSRRCRQTLEPLARRRGLELEIDPRLAEDGDADALERLVDDLSDSHVLLCAHGDRIPSLLVRLGLPREHARCAKASIWRIQSLDGQRIASYDPPPSAELDAGTRLAALDLGSTSFHLLVADMYDDGRLERVKRKRQMLRLGALLADAKERLSDDVVERVCDAAAELRDSAWSAGAKALHCVATAAFRDGAHGRQLASMLGARLRTPIRIFSGVEEAHAIFAAFRRRLDLGPEPVLGLDLGGGSLELAIGDSGHVHWETTLPLGAVRMQQRFAIHKVDADLDGVRAHVRRAVLPLRERITGLEVKRCLVTGGTARALGRLLLARPKAKPRPLVGLEVSHETLTRLRLQLAAASHDERLALPGMNPERVDLLPTGAAVLEEVLATLGQPSLTICDWGLREGVLLSAMRDARRDRREIHALGAVLR